MINTLPKSLLEAAMRVVNKKLPAAYISFRHVDHSGHDLNLYESYDTTHIDNWHEKRDNKRNALLQLELDQEHTDDDKTHIYRYTAASRPVNKELFNRYESGNTSPLDKFDVNSNRYNFTHDLKGLDAAISRNKLKHELVTYSGVGEHVIARKNQEGLLHLPAYTSTTVDKSTAHHFADSNRKNFKNLHILRIVHPEGSAGVYTHNDADITQYATESEYVMPRGTTLHIKDSPEIYHDDHGNRVHVWTAHRLLEHEKPVDTSYKTPDTLKTVMQKGKLKVTRVDTLREYKKHYKDQYALDEEGEFHESHVNHPVYHIHTPDGTVYRSDLQGNEVSFIQKRANGSRMRATKDKLLAKYPELKEAEHIFKPGNK